MVNSVELKLQKSGLQKQTAKVLATSTFTVAKSAIPVILAPNGTVATNGVITLGTALPLVYAGAWVRLPAGAVVGGLAGLYFVTFTSTTVGQVTTSFADPATAFTPSIPTTLINAVGSNAAYTQATTEVTLVNVAAPANSIGADGAIEVTILQSNNNSGGLKTLNGKFGAGLFLSSAVTTSLAMETFRRVVNRGVTGNQLVLAGPAFGTTSTVAPTQLAIDTTVAVAIALTGTVAVATDYLVVESFVVEVRAS